MACFDEKRCYITDGKLKPLAYFDADAYIAACGISDDGSVDLTFRPILDRNDGIRPERREHHAY